MSSLRIGVRHRIHQRCQRCSRKGVYVGVCENECENGCGVAEWRAPLGVVPGMPGQQD